ncbi:hypothetical protein BEP19_15800 [Ammoniphilus oxalaticus]|uniref:Uncharacterized protein n=1 Tax=Ammoniphilus oxalaticus TaxID=66863 RepID=A0A419SDH4_9BACL|nr:hypothetical protein [Ammoniphilus oxalaticus]RKD21134.1 hypothetical protein BEP19_15800 [Ammoniphilus oxalaticus]
MTKFTVICNNCGSKDAYVWADSFRGHPRLQFECSDCENEARTLSEELDETDILSDKEDCTNNVKKVYTHCTGGKITDPDHNAKEVIERIEEYYGTLYMS